MEELIARAVEAAKAPFNSNRSYELPSLRSVAEQLGTTVIRTRKLLITARYFSSPTAQSVQRLKAELTVSTLLFMDIYANFLLSIRLHLLEKMGYLLSIISFMITMATTYSRPMLRQGSRP